jgi:hypothetical protein
VQTSYPCPVSLASALALVVSSPAARRRVVAFYRALWRLSRKRGYCYAGNEYLADEFGVDPATVRRWRSDLEQAGFIRCEYDPGEERRIFTLIDTKQVEQIGKLAQGTPRMVRRVPRSAPYSLLHGGNNNRSADVQPVQAVGGVPSSVPGVVASPELAPEPEPPRCTVAAGLASAPQVNPGDSNETHEQTISSHPATSSHPDDLQKNPVKTAAPRRKSLTSRTESRASSPARGGREFSDFRKQGASASKPSEQHPGRKPASARPAPCLSPSASGLLSEVEALSVTSHVAHALLAEHGEETLRQHLAALPYRRPRDPAAVFVGSVRGGWLPPAGYVQAQAAGRAAAQKAAARAVGASVARSEASRRETLAARFLGLSGAEREALENQSREALLSELPAVARLVLDRGGPAAENLVRNRALALLAAAGP